MPKSRLLKPLLKLPNKPAAEELVALAGSRPEVRDEAPGRRPDTEVGAGTSMRSVP